MYVASMATSNGEGARTCSELPGSGVGDWCLTGWFSVLRECRKGPCRAEGADGQVGLLMQEACDRIDKEGVL